MFSHTGIVEPGMSDVHPVCARFHAAIELIGAKWSGAVLQALFTGSHRFGDIRAAIPGVSDIMLTRRLRELEDAGLVERRVMPTSPVHVEYHLTQMGREAGPVLDARSEEHTSELQSPCNLVCRLLLEKKKIRKQRAERQIHAIRRILRPYFIGGL